MGNKQESDNTQNTAVDEALLTTADLTDVSLPRTRRRLRHYWPHLVAVLALCGLSAVSYLFWTEVNKRFPLMASGAYLGALDGGVLDEPGRSVTLYIEKEAGAETLTILLLKRGWSPQSVIPVTASSGTEQSASVLPINLNGPAAKLELQGSLLPDGEYQGEVLNVGNKSRGKWWVRPLPEEPAAEGASSDREKRVKLLLHAELSEIEAKISEAEKVFPERQAEIQILTNVVSEGERLKTKANEKYEQAVAELQRVRQALKEKRAEAGRLEAAVKVSQRVTSTGKLVSLSRESLEREWRFADSMLRAESNERSAELDAAYERGQSIMQMKRDIALEEERIEELLAFDSGQGGITVEGKNIVEEAQDSE